MTRVCIVGKSEFDLRTELLTRETSRAALASYDLGSPFENTLAVDTISLGQAVSLLNDLNWYLVRFTDAALVLEPSVSEEEWLSRPLARAIRDSEVDPDETGDLLKVYGVADGRLVEPMFVQRVEDGSLPEYDLREVEETVRVRVTSDEFQ